MRLRPSPRSVSSTARPKAIHRDSLGAVACVKFDRTSWGLDTDGQRSAFPSHSYTGSLLDAVPRAPGFLF